MTRAATVAPPATQISGQPYRLTAVLALLGAALLGVGTWLHPADADPGVPAAFSEYAADGRAGWVTAHLLQFGGVASMTLAMVLLARGVAGPGGAAWARVTAVCATAGFATAAVLQAVDGVALKAMVDLWSSASDDRPTLFAATLAVRQVEIGLDALLALVLAAAFLSLGVALLTAPGRSRGLGALALATAATAAANGLALALGGFSDTAMLATTASGLLGLAFLLTAAVWSWRRVATRRE
jgi:hypothetical protein